MAAPPPRAGADRGRDPDRPRKRVVRLRHQARPRRDGRAACRLRPRRQVADGATIHAFSHIEGATIGAKASIGPFARIRPAPGSASNTKVGNFVELKKAEIGEGAKVNHLSYVGDAAVGAEANIGAGTITCNYDGFRKYGTVIGAGAFIGSNTALVAPVTVGDGAIVGAGSVITRDVEPDSLAVERSEQKGITGWAKRFRERMTRKAAE